MPNMEISENLIQECIDHTDVLKSFEMQAKSQGSVYAQVVLMKVHEALTIDKKNNITNLNSNKGPKPKSYGYKNPSVSLGA